MGFGREKEMGCPFCGLRKGKWGGSVDKLQTALSNLVHDTQHEEHECADANCPVRKARELIAVDHWKARQLNLICWIAS